MLAIRSLVVPLVLLAVGGCASYGTISGVTRAGQQTVYIEGRETLLSTRVNSVAVTPLNAVVRHGDRLVFLVSVRNGTSQPFNISPESMVATASSPAPSRPLRVFAYEDLVAEESTRQKWIAVGAILQSAGAAMGGGAVQHEGTYSGTAVSGSGGVTYSSGTYRGTTYDNGAAQAQANQNVERVVRDRDAAFSRLEATMLKRHTVLPGQVYGGRVVVEPLDIGDAPGAVELRIDLGGEIHQFAFRQARADR